MGAKIKFDVSASDPDKATVDYEPPKPGVYTAKVEAVNPGFSKGEDGKPDKSRPRLEVVYRIASGKNKGAPLWDYLSFSEAAQWRLDQFLQAFGIASKKKRKGTFDADDVIGQLCKIRIKGETNNGEYRARVGTVMATTDTEDDLDAEEEEEEEEESEDEFEDEEEEEESEDEEEDLVALGETVDSGGKGAAAAEARLKDLASDAGLDPDDYETWEELANALKEEEDPF